MKSLFLALALLCCAVPALAAGQIHDLTLENIEEKLAACNARHRGDWSPRLAREEPAAAWYDLRLTTAFVAGHEHASQKINRIQFFISTDGRIPSEDGRRMQYISDMSSAVQAAAALCLPGFDKDAEQMAALEDALTYMNSALSKGEKCVFTSGGYRFTAMIVDGVYTVWVERI